MFLGAFFAQKRQKKSAKPGQFAARGGAIKEVALFCNCGAFVRVGERIGTLCWVRAGAENVWARSTGKRVQEGMLEPFAISAIRSAGAGGLGENVRAVRGGRDFASLSSCAI